MIQKWLGATDGNGACVRVLLFDYRKAFDLIDHKILVNKLKHVNIPNSVINWVIDFQEDLKESNLEKTAFLSGAQCRLECHRGQSWAPGFPF